MRILNRNWDRNSIATSRGRRLPVGPEGGFWREKGLAQSWPDRVEDDPEAPGHVELPEKELLNL